MQGLSGKSLFQQQLQTGKMDMPTMSSALKDSGTINFSLEEDEEKQRGGKNESKLKPFKGIENVQDDIALTEVTIHETTAEKYDTALSSIQYRQSPKVSFRTSFVDSFFLVQNILSKSLQRIIILTFSD